MVFSSPEFLFIFLPAAGLLLLASHKSVNIQNIILVCVSLVFYAWGNPAHVLLLLASILANYAFARLIEKSAESAESGAAGRRKTVLTTCVAMNIFSLCAFKYAGFLAANLNLIPGVNIPAPDIRLPVGISFYTFQIISYLVDVGSGKHKAQRNIIKFALYISLFPQLIAGPIIRYGDIEGMLSARSPAIEDVAYGLRRFIFGLSKKLLVANPIGGVADAAFSFVSPSTPVAWIGAVAYTLQIYFDFSAYSDMAIGICGMFGFKVPENFDYPYSARGLRDFWRRWHMSLSTWFRDYVYIPLGGNRRGKLRETLNKTAVFFLTGLWHGASWTFIVWGLFHGFFITLETFNVFRTRKWPRFVAWLYTMLVVVAGFVIFRSPTLADALRMLTSMFAGFAAGNANDHMAQAIALFNPSVIPALAAAVLAVFPLKRVIETRLPKLQLAGFLLTAPLFFLCVLSLATATYNPFIYYRF